MEADIFERLADVPVPPPPPPVVLQRGVHQRLNTRLLVRHLFDFIVRGFPYVLLTVFPAVFGMLERTVTGKCEIRRRHDEPDQAPPQ